MIVDTKYQFGRGLPIEAMARNGQITDGANMAALANYINMIAARRFKVLAQASNSIGGLISASALIEAKWHTSPNCGGVEVLLVLGPSTSATVFGQYAWNVNSVAQTTRYISGNTGGVNGPNDLIIDRLRFVDGSGNPLAGDTDYEAFMLLTNAACIYYVIYELPRSTLDTDTDTAIPTDVFAYNAPILDRDVATMVDALWKIYRRQGTSHFSWNFTGTSGSPPSQNSTTWKNVLDGSTAGWSSSAAGFWTVPYRKNRLTGSTVDVVLYGYGGTNGGTDNGRLRFVNSAGVIGTITGYTSTIDEFRETTATLDATISTSDLVIVEHSVNAGINSMRTWAAGIYEYLA